jgi:phosphoglycolate phosphatase
MAPAPELPSPLLVFDLDGTLVDSAPDLLATLDAILPRHGFSAQPDPTLRNGIGHGARHLIEYALQRRGIVVEEAQLAAMHEDFIAYYEANICVHTRPYPGLIALLDRFAPLGWKFAVCTNKLEGLSRLVLERLGLSKRFLTVCGGDTFAVRKPEAGHLFGTIEQAGGARGRTIMLGDSQTDLDTARNAAIPFVGVSFGYTPIPMAELLPDILLDAYDELSPDTAAELLARGPVSRQERAIQAAIS